MHFNIEKAPQPANPSGYHDSNRTVGTISRWPAAVLVGGGGKAYVADATHDTWPAAMSATQGTTTSTHLAMQVRTAKKAVHCETRS
jgi:hypothetical protein